MPISRLNHTAFALAVYASCRGFPTTSKTRFRLVADLYRVGLITHRDMLKGFMNKGACYSPLPGLSMARRNRGLVQCDAEFRFESLQPNPKHSRFTTYRKLDLGEHWKLWS